MSSRPGRNVVLAVASSLDSSPLSIAAMAAAEEFGVPDGERVSFFAVLLHGSPEVAIC